MNQKRNEFLLSLRHRVPLKVRQAISPAIVACCLATQAQAAAIPVPNGDFESLYKPGSTTITAHANGGWTHGVGSGVVMDTGGPLAIYSDATTGNTVDIPGWVNATGWAPSYSWASGGSGSVSGSAAGHTYGTNGSNWGNSNGGAIQSAGALTTVASGETYTLSAYFNAGLPESGRVLDLMADGVILTPDSSSNPTGAGTYARTYASGSLAGFVGQSLTIRVGWAVGIAGTQAQLDNVQLAGDLVVDTTPPTLTSIEDNKSGGPITENEQVIYTVTFSEAMSAPTVNAADFTNASATTMTVNSVTPTGNPAVFLVMATPTQPGTLQLQIAMGAALTDLDGNALDTTAALPDDTSIVVNVYLSNACDITSFGANVAGSFAEITTTSPTTGTVAWIVPSGTTVATLAPTYTLSASATCDQPNDGSTLPTPAFSIGTPVPYVVTAQDLTSSKTYTVTVSVIPDESALIWNVAGGGDWDHTSPNWLGQTSATVMPFFNTLNAVFNKIEGGTIAIASGVMPGSTTVNAASGTYTFSGSPLTTGSLTKSGNGNLTIAIANNSFSGGTTINGGQLTMDLLANAALGTGPVTLNGGILYLQRITATNDLIVNGGSLYPDNGWGDNWNGPVTLNSDLIIQGPYYATMTFNGSISGVGGLTLNGQGPVALQVANSYEGPTRVTDCTLICNHIDALGSGGLSISSGAKVKLNYTGEHNIATLTLGGVPQASGTHGSVLSGADYQSDVYFDATGTGMVRVPPSSAADMLTFSFGALGAAAIGDTTITLEVPYGTGRTALSPTYTVSLGATCDPASPPASPLDFTGAQTYTVTAEDGTIKEYTVTVTEAILPDIFTWANSGNGNWNDSANWTNELAIVATPLSGGRSSYTLNFTAAGTYTATNNLSAAFQLNKLNFGAAVTLAGNSLAFVANGATLPAINQNSASLVIIPNPLDLSANTTFGGTGNGEVRFGLTSLITGAGSLTKNGTGTLKIFGKTNSFTGGTIINSGTLFMDVEAKLGTGPITLNGGTLFMYRFKPTNSLIINGGSIYSDNGFNDNTLAGPVTLNATLPCNVAYNLTCTNTISGAGGLTKTGAKNMILTNTCTSTYTGPTSVTAGTLECKSTNAVSGSSALSISGTGKMNLAYVGTKTVASLTLGGVAQTVPGTYGSIASGANFPSDTYFTVGSTGTVTVVAGFTSWASTNAPGQTPGQDYDNDGVDNGLEYFMGQTGSSFTAMPGLDATNKVTWTKNPTYSGTWQIQTSPDLAAWTNVVGTDNGTSVSYTLPTGLGTQFVRLLVTPTP